MKNFIIALLTFSFVSAYAQTIRQPGQVLTLKNLTVANASVSIAGTNAECITDESGIFSLVIPSALKKTEPITIRVQKGGYRTVSKLIAISPVIVTIKLAEIPKTKKNLSTSTQQTPVKPVSVPDGPISTDTKESHVVNGNGNTVGVNGNINYGVRQRHLTDAVLTYILLSLPDKSAEITLLWAGGKEGEVYATEIYGQLLQREYKNIKPSNWMDPDGYDKVFVTKQNGNLQLRIYPASNVQ